MNKALVIAAREYRSAVKTKGFIVSLVMMPVMMAGSAGIQVLFKKLEDTKDKKYAVVDRTPDGNIAKSLVKSAEQYNEHFIFDPETKNQIHPRIVLEVINTTDHSDVAIKQQRYEQSQRVEKDEIEAFIEIGANVLKIRSNFGAEKAKDEESIRWQAKKPGEGFTGRWFDRQINEIVQLHRFAAEKYDPVRIKVLQQPVEFNTKGLTKKDPVTGEIIDSANEKQLANFFLPGILIALMFMVIMVGATPAMQGIVEEKSQRIAEVLLGSVTPTQLMFGKLLGVVGVASTMAVVYLVGGYLVASRYDLVDAITVRLIFWFIVFLFLALMIYGSLFIAVGAAAGDIKDTQTLLMPIMIFACLPFFALGPIMMDPNGKVAVVCSFMPFAAPMLLVARESVPPGVPLWQMITGIAIVLATTGFCVWAAGRIFRIGILMQGKGAKIGDLIRWVIKG